MPFYEIIYEPGAKSVASYTDDNEAQSALKAHNDKAMSGEPATPESTPRPELEGTLPTVGTWAAERIKKVFVYDQHPADFTGDQLIDTETLKAAFDKATAESGMQGSVHAPTVAAAIREAASPINPDAGKHESQYKQEADRELDLSFLEASE